MIKTVIFFNNGMAAVTDDEGNQVPKYQGNHQETINKLKEDGIDIWENPKILVLGIAFSEEKLKELKEYRESIL